MISRLLWHLAKARRLKQILPKSVKRPLRRFLPLRIYDPLRWLAEDPYADVEEVSTYPARVNVRLGIIKEFTRLHSNYIGACRELGVPYTVLDISGPDWIGVVENSGCDAFLVWPSGLLTAWKQMYDDRLKIMVDELGKIIYPTYDELWVWESKRRMHYWLKANNIPHPRTWVFYNRFEAMEFAESAELPIVYKADLGATAMGVRILRNSSKAKRLINRCFKKGIVRKGGDKRDKQWGSVLFQEYLLNVTEWRILRLGNSYFGHQKLKRGDFHSGSGETGWYDPPKKLLDFARNVTEKGGFTSMDLDIFETIDGRYLINELQSLFGSHLPYQMLVNDKPGRYIYEPLSDRWIFEQGVFCRNASCNLRVEALLEVLGKPLRL